MNCEASSAGPAPYNHAMESAGRQALEREVRRLCDAGDLNGAATAVLCALHRDEADAADVFSAFSEALWKGLPGFAWQCALRTWAYTLARHASYRFLRGTRQIRKGVPLSDASIGEKLAQEVRTATRSYLRTETKDRFAELRESLEPDDQLLLVLRVDRGLEWNELVRVLAETEDFDDATLLREAARLRKRFQLLKERLVKLAKASGLKPS
jgi:RNA polymerase sigma-70 factor (ECF subfamily)